MPTLKRGSQLFLPLHRRPATVELSREKRLRHQKGYELRHNQTTYVFRAFFEHVAVRRVRVLSALLKSEPQ